MFETVLIANRGEIARRLIRAVQELGLAAVAVYSDADKDAPYVQEADKAVPIGASEATKSYLDIQKILDAAEATGAGAIHPGYGFLSENADFARACEALNIAFIGPKSSIIEEMGSKIAAKARAVNAGVPIVPGYQGAEQTDEALVRAGKDVGFPLMVKASAGGGGRGMRLVPDEKELASAISLARQEAVSAFGDGALLLERYIPAARHVEVQVLGDKQGHVIHLYDRDCSLQRNHQKIIEEAPAPNLPDHIRQEMLAAATVLARDIGYDSAGTVEFIYDPQTEEYFFLEMNTRLQVEHPVTEMITGVDIAAWQIRIANGEALSLYQSHVTCTGWAMEARVTAEDPANGYMPQTGKVVHYQEPIGTGIRMDSGISDGSLISHYYDSLLAKVIVHGETRGSTLQKLSKALKNYHLVGVTTNIPFLIDMLNTDDFVAVSHHTQTLKQMQEQGWQNPAPCDREKAIALLVHHLKGIDAHEVGPWKVLADWRITGRLGWNATSYYYLPNADGDMRPASITRNTDGYQVTFENAAIINLNLLNCSGKSIHILYQGVREKYDYAVLGDSICMFGEKGAVHIAPQLIERAILTRRDAGGGSGNQVIAPMPGLVVDLLTEEGAPVTKGQPLIVLEAMKLMQKLSAPCDGVVGQISVAAGDTPEKGAILIEIKPEKTAE